MDIIYWNDYSHHSLGNHIDLQCSFDSKKYDKEIVDVIMKGNVKFRALHSFSCNWIEEKCSRIEGLQWEGKKHEEKVLEYLFKE